MLDGKGRRAKGSAGERQFFGLLSDQLGTAVRRNIGQSREGGADSWELDGWAIEVKRQETLQIATWWQQACDQAERAYEREKLNVVIPTVRLPALAYRQSRQPWRIVIPVCAFGDNFSAVHWEFTATVGLPEFCLVVRERIMTPEEHKHRQVVKAVATYLGRQKG